MKTTRVNHRILVCDGTTERLTRQGASSRIRRGRQLGYRWSNITENTWEGVNTSPDRPNK